MRQVIYCDRVSEATGRTCYGRVMQTDWDEWAEDFTCLQCGAMWHRPTEAYKRFQALTAAIRREGPPPKRGRPSNETVAARLPVPAAPTSREMREAEFRRVEQVVRDMSAAGATCEEIARETNRHVGTISNIRGRLGIRVPRKGRPLPANRKEAACAT